jgi:aminocarboxymuconate-semialdehyde decarboxylase
MKRPEKRPDTPAAGRRNFLKLGSAAGAMAVLPSCVSNPQSGAAGPRSIDVHAHWSPEAYVKLVQAAGQTPRIPGKPIDPRMLDLERRLEWMDQRGVEMHVLTLSGSMPWQWATPEQADRLAQVVNDAAVAAHTKYPTRFIAGAAVPIRDPAAALKELNRVAGRPGMRAVGLPNSIEGNDYLFRPEYLPFLARCEELGYPLLFHPLDGVANHYGGRERLAGGDFIYNTLGFPFESATTATKFIFSGVLDRFPKLDVVLPHSGGAFPYVVGRIEHSITKDAVSTKLARPIREYMRRFHYDSLAYYPETLRFMIDLLGSDRIVIGTDNYATMDVQYPNALVESLNLPAADRDRIFRGNAVRLLKLQSS